MGASPNLIIRLVKIKNGAISGEIILVIVAAKRRIDANA
jgi:hypothetical protein